MSLVTVVIDDQGNPECTHKFEGCTEDGKLVIDPYESDVYENTVWVVACDNCYDHLCQAI